MKESKMVCRECGFEPEGVMTWDSGTLPLDCPNCGEHALRPELADWPEAEEEAS